MATNHKNITSEIELAEVGFLPASFADPGGRVFFWRGDFYRAITADRADFTRRLFANGTVDRLVNKKLLVESELTDLKLAGYELILKHRALPFVSYCYEWSAEMLYDAAALLCALDEALVEEGLVLHDAHSWNIVFDGCNPIFVDFNSIAPLQPENTGQEFYGQFCRSFLYPLQLMCHNQDRVVRALFLQGQGVLQSEVEALTAPAPADAVSDTQDSRLLRLAKDSIPVSVRQGLKRSFAKSAPVVAAESADQTPLRVAVTQQIKQDIAAISLPDRITDWLGYYSDNYPSFTPSDDWTAKHRTAYEVLSELRPKSMLDIGSNRGWYSRLAALHGSRVVAGDVDAVCSGQLYKDAKSDSTSNSSILPLVLDFTNPSPGMGVCNAFRPPATERLRCEMVFALALTHHLVFKQLLRFEQIVAGLSSFSERWLLVEFVSKDDRFVKEWWTEQQEWYTLENFKTTLLKEFSSVREYPSDNEERTLLLCER